MVTITHALLVVGTIKGHPKIFTFVDHQFITIPQIVQVIREGVIDMLMAGKSASGIGAQLNVNLLMIRHQRYNF